MDITGASAIVTGGASGIGAATARLLADRGAKVVIADLQEDKGNALADEIGGGFCKVDVTNTDDRVNAVEMAKSMGPVRVLVSSAGIGWAQRTIETLGNYGEVFERNLGAGTELDLKRGQNAAWNQGGLLYAPRID